MGKRVYSPSEQTDMVYLSKHLEICSHFFIHDIARLHSLQQPYSSPFKVVSKHKFFSVHIKNEEQNISLDRLKPAILENVYLKVAP